MVAIHPLISKSSSPFTNRLVIVPSTPITNGITVSFMFQSCCFFSSSSKVEVLISLFAFFQFYHVVSWMGKVYHLAGFLSLSLSLSPSLLTITSFGPLVEIRWFICISKSQMSLSVSFSWTYTELCIYHYMVKFKLLAQFPVDHLTHPVVSSLILFGGLIYCIRLLCDRSFHFNYHVIYISCFVASCLFLLSHSPYSDVLCCYLKRFSFYLKVSLF